MHSKKKILVLFMVTQRYLWLPEKYCNNILGFTLNLQLNTVISLTDIMLIYQPADAEICFVPLYFKVFVRH